MKKALVFLSVFFVLMFFLSCSKEGSEPESQSALTAQKQEAEGKETAKTSGKETAQATEENPMVAMQKVTEQIEEQSERQQGGEITVSGKATFNVRDYGAVGDGATLDTKSIQSAVDACANATPDSNFHQDT